MPAPILAALLFHRTTSHDKGTAWKGQCGVEGTVVVDGRARRELRGWDSVRKMSDEENGPPPP